MRRSKAVLYMDYPHDELCSLFRMVATDGYSAIANRIAEIESELMGSAMIFWGGDSGEIYNEGFYPGQQIGRLDGISVLVPICAAEKYIPHLFEAFKKQSLAPALFEVVFVIHGEPGQMPSMLATEAQHVPFAVKILRIDAHGQHRACNISLGFGLRQYFCMVNAEDEIEKDFLLDAYRFASPDSVVLTNVLRNENARMSLDSYGRLLISGLSDFTPERLHKFFSTNLYKLVPRRMVCGQYFEEKMAGCAEIVFWLLFLVNNELTLKTSFVPGRSNAYIRNVVPVSDKMHSLDKSFTIDQRIAIVNSLNRIGAKNIACSVISSNMCRDQAQIMVEDLELISMEMEEVLDATRRCTDYQTICVILDAYMDKHELKPDSGTFHFFVKYYLARIVNIGMMLPGVKSHAARKELLEHIQLLHEEVMALCKNMDNFQRKFLFEQCRQITLPFFNQSLFGSANGIAFISNTTAIGSLWDFITGRRLNQISGLNKELIKWDSVLFTNPCRIDDIYSAFADWQCVSVSRIEMDNDDDEYSLGKKGATAVQGKEPQVIYSGGAGAESHIAALMYKGSHPQIKWYAEFATPLCIDGEGRRRESPLDMEKRFRGDFYAYTEAQILGKADILIFSNKKQLESCITHNSFIEDAPSVFAKSHCIIPPPLKKILHQLSTAEYILDDKLVNIGHFSICERSPDLKTIYSILASNENICFHLFTTNITKNDVDKNFKDRIHINKYGSFIDALKIAATLNYIYIEDIESSDINSFLPPEFTSFLQTGTKLLVKTVQGSPLSDLRHHSIVPLHAFMKEIQNAHAEI